MARGCITRTARLSLFRRSDFFSQNFSFMRKIFKNSIVASPFGYFDFDFRFMSNTETETS
jgi:hypothetical protein